MGWDCCYLPAWIGPVQFLQIRPERVLRLSRGVGQLPGIMRHMRPSGRLYQ